MRFADWLPQCTAGMAQRLRLWTGVDAVPLELLRQSGETSSLMVKAGNGDTFEPMTRRLFVSEADVAAARRLLATVARAEAPDDDVEEQEGGGASPGRGLDQARMALTVRERRLRGLGGVFAAEPAFTLLLALYATEEWEPAMTITRLSQLTLLSTGTAKRWLEQLTGEGWIERRGDEDDGRRTLLSLSIKARETLETLFSG